jgi:hypothetical protein
MRREWKNFNFSKHLNKTRRKLDVLLWPAFYEVRGGDVLAYHEACSLTCSVTVLDQTVAAVSCCKAERVKAISSYPSLGLCTWKQRASDKCSALRLLPTPPCPMSSSAAQQLLDPTTLPKCECESPPEIPMRGLDSGRIGNGSATNNWHGLPPPSFFDIYSAVRGSFIVVLPMTSATIVACTPWFGGTIGVQWVHSDRRGNWHGVRELAVGRASIFICAWQSNPWWSQFGPLAPSRFPVSAYEDILLSLTWVWFDELLTSRVSLIWTKIVFGRGDDILLVWVVSL